MKSTLSLIPSLDNFLSITSTSSKKDYTYAEQYPVFISQEKLSKLIGKPQDPSSSPPSQLRQSLISKSDKPESPFTQKSHNKTQSVEFHMSKFPSSSLNIELEKQVILSELYQNIDKLKTKPKLFPPIKVVRPKHLRAKADTSSVKSARVNIKSLLNSETISLPCTDCQSTRCICRVTDSFCDQTWDQVKHKHPKRTDIYHPVNRSKILGRTPHFDSNPSDFNPFADKISQKRTRRRRPVRGDFSSLHSELLQISPKNIYMKVLEEEFN